MSSYEFNAVSPYIKGNIDWYCRRSERKTIQGNNQSINKDDESIFNILSLSGFGWESTHCMAYVSLLQSGGTYNGTIIDNS